MLFNSIEFLLFLPVVFCLYWFVTNRNLRLQNALVILASYVFYGAWDWRFLGLIFLSSLVDFLIGRQMGALPEEAERQRKWLLRLSLLVNLGLLGVFKYYNFFTDSLIDLLTSIGVEANFRTLHIILPVGISFYTFQTLSYTIDIYRGKIEPTQDPIAFFAFVSFFPQLVAGPIERAKNLLPQFHRQRQFDFNEARDGARQILWGFFKKIVIADNCGLFVDKVFADVANAEPLFLFWAVFFFAIQIYADFSGYTDIAIGTGRLFGFRLSPNFHFPYFASSMGTFWRKWHISLTTWLMDYVYYPIALGLRQYGKMASLTAILLTFTLSGLWHGAGFNFIWFGVVHALVLSVEFLTNQPRKNLYARYPKLMDFTGWLVTMFFVGLALIFFRIESMSDIGIYFTRMLSPQLVNIPPNKQMLLIVGVFMLIEWLGRHQAYPIEQLKFPKFIRWVSYTSIIVAIIILGEFSKKDAFIYFQF